MQVSPATTSRFPGTRRSLTTPAACSPSRASRALSLCLGIGLLHTSAFLELSAQTFTLSLDGPCGETIVGSPGTVYDDGTGGDGFFFDQEAFWEGFADVPQITSGHTWDIVLTTSDNPTVGTDRVWGAGSWVWSLAEEGALDIVDVTTRGTVSCQRTAGSPCRGVRSFEWSQLIEDEGKEGAYGAVVLDARNPIELIPEGAEVIAKVRVRAEFPRDAGGGVLGRLVFRDGLVTFNGPLRNTVSFQGNAHVPRTVPCAVRLASHPLERCEPTLDEPDGERESDASRVLQFGTRANLELPGEHRMEALVLADLDRNGWLDIAATSQSSEEITLHFGRGRGEFDDPRGLAAAAGFKSIATADLNGDGLPDLAASNRWTHEVRVFLGRGDGTFLPAEVLDEGIVIPSHLLADDLERDGDVDLALASGDDVAVLLAAGDGTFEPVRRFPSGGHDLQALAAGDFDDDGAVDLAAGSSIGITILRGAGDGTFAEVIDVLGPPPTTLIAADFDLDGRLDLVGGGHLLIGRGDGSFLARRIPLSAPTALSDFDGDGALDLAEPGSVFVAGRHRAATATVLLGRGDSTFAPQSTFRVGPATVTRLGSAAVVAGDIDRDGYVDLVSGIPLGLSVAFGKGDGTFMEFGPIVGTGTRVVAVDLDLDGSVDLATVGPSRASVRLGLGDGTFGVPRDFEPGGVVQSVVAADFDRDGGVDLALAHLEPTISVLLGAGDGSFEAPRSHGVDDELRGLVTADFNLDGVPDLAATHQFARRISVLLGSGSGDFPERGVVSTEGFPLALAAADFDGGGAPDLAAAQSDGTVSVFLGTSDGAFREGSCHAVGEHPVSLVAADFDGDGAADLATASEISENVTVLLSNGGGGFRRAQTLSIGGRRGPMSNLIARDLDEDGFPDLAITELTDILVFLGRGDGTFHRPRRQKTGVSVLGSLGGDVLFAADLNDDGKLDVGLGEHVFLNRTVRDCNVNGVSDDRDIAEGTSRDADSNGIPDECQIRFHRGDSNHDGRADITDALYTIAYIFLGGPPPTCMESADTNADRRVNSADPIFLLNFLFRAGVPLPAPGPPPNPCGSPPPQFVLGCELYEKCE